jgi:hypothetical protein
VKPFLKFRVHYFQPRSRNVAKMEIPIRIASDKLPAPARDPVLPDVVYQAVLQLEIQPKCPPSKSIFSFGPCRYDFLPLLKHGTTFTVNFIGLVLLLFQHVRW